MSIFDLNAYEVVLTEDLPDLKSKGYLLKHKKSGAQTVPEFRISWNIPCSAVREISRLRIRLWSLSKDR